MKNVILLLFCSILISCNKKQEVIKEKKFITDSIIYEIVNTVLEMPEIKKDSAKYMLNTGNIFMFPPNLDENQLYNYINKNFGSFDTISFEKQIYKSRDSYYKQEFIKSHQLIDYDLTTPKTRQQFDSLQNYIEKNYSNHISVSLPFFISDSVIYISYIYNNHYQRDFFMIKKNDKWEFYKDYNFFWYL